MYYSNGVVITHEANEVDFLFEAKEKLQRWFELEKGIVSEFVVSDLKGTPVLEIPEGIEYVDVEICLNPEIKLRSFNGESLKLQAKHNVEIKHIFTVDEMIELRDDLAKTVLELESQKTRKAQIVKQYNAKIEELDDHLSATAHTVNQGYEYRTVDCDVVLDFESKKRLYVDPSSGLVAKTEDLRSTDYQLTLFVGDKEEIDHELKGDDDDVF